MHKAYINATGQISGMKRVGDHVVAVGFDGFIDLIVKPVRQVRNGKKQYFSTIGEFGGYLTGKSALSCSLDLEKVAEKAGGNMPLFACALSALGVKTDCIGSLGYPEPQEIFRNMGELVSITGVAGAGTCTSLEFDDGKVMLGCNGDVDNLDFAMLESRVGIERLQAWLEQADAAAFLNWSELPGSTSIWRGLLEQVLPTAGGAREKWLMLDISDCSRRAPEEICEMISLIGELNRFYKVIFSVNHNEAMILCGALGLPREAPEQAAALLFGSSNVELLVLHLLDGAVCCDGSGVEFIPSRRVDKPLISTGGGDNFNAGLLWALLEGLPHREAVATANIVSGLYVSNGKSPCACDILESVIKK